MAEVMNTNMERHYFTHILDNPEQITKVEPHFFRNHDIQFVYTVIREEYLRSEKHIVPSSQQIYSMIKLADQENKINDKVIKMLISSDNADISPDWLIPRFKAWKIEKELQGSVLKAIDMVQQFKDIDYENALDVANKMKNMFQNVTLVDDDDLDLGADFDDPENHKQLLSKTCISTGWNSVDTILGGGWSKQTFSVIMGETNVGKCCVSGTYIKIKNKKTGKIEKITIGDFYKMAKNKI